MDVLLDIMTLLITKFRLPSRVLFHPMFIVGSHRNSWNLIGFFFAATAVTVAGWCL